MTQHIHAFIPKLIQSKLGQISYRRGRVYNISAEIVPCNGNGQR